MNTLKTNKPKGISNKRQYKLGTIGAEYSNKHAGAHALKESHGVVTYGNHKACK